MTSKIAVIDSLTWRCREPYGSLWRGYYFIEEQPGFTFRTGGHYILCGSSLHWLFEIPYGARTLWLTLYKHPSKFRHRLFVRDIYVYLQGAELAKVGLTPATASLLDESIERMGKPSQLYVGIEYCEGDIIDGC